MKSQDEITQKRLELSLNLSNLFSDGRIESEDMNIVLKQIEILDWILGIDNE